MNIIKNETRCEKKSKPQYTSVYEDLDFNYVELGKPRLSNNAVVGLYRRTLGSTVIVSAIEKASIKVFPNPASGSISVWVDGATDRIVYSSMACRTK